MAGREATGARAPLSPALAGSPPQRFDLSGAKILIADDNPLALDILIQVLMGFSAHGWTQCVSIAEAANFLDRTPYDHVIVDGEMPEKDGFDLTRHLRSDPGKPNFTTPVVLVCGFTPKDKVFRARDFGANSVVTKPIIPSVLLSRIERLAKKPRLFVSGEVYSGPDRRFRAVPLPPGQDDRRAGPLQDDPERHERSPVSQDIEI